MASALREVVLKIRELEHKMGEAKTREELDALDAEMQVLLEAFKEKMAHAPKLMPRPKAS